MPATADVPEPSEKQLHCDMLHEYYGSDDRLLCYVRRHEARGEQRKQFYPLTYGTLNGKTGWHSKHPNAPKPLYRLNWLSHADPNAVVILCEGEKAAEATQRMFPDHVAMSWMGGAKAAAYADLRPLHGRDVIIWPDNDADGRKAADELQRRLPGVRVLTVDDLPDGADAADVHTDDPETWLTGRLSESEHRGRLYGKLRVLGVAELDTATHRDYLLKGLLSPAEISIG
jgi:putative DNA primase/helicase